MDRSEALSLLAAAPERTALLLDFDGTLAQVVDDPATATPLDGVLAVLSALGESGYTVSAISGRSIDFLAERLPDHVDLSGLYGLEWRRGGRIGEHPQANTWEADVARLTAEAEAALPGVLVEPKRLSITLHYRTAPDRQAEVEAFAERAARTSGMQARPAKRSVELHPPVDADKGAAVAHAVLGAEIDAACYIGDDLGDLPAFSALDALAAGGVKVVKVAVRSEEAPAALLEAADLCVAGPPGALELLQELVRLTDGGAG